MTNVTCRVKVTKEVPTGLVIIQADIIRIDDVFIHLMLYYRYTGGFRPYLLDYKVNGCEVAKQANYHFSNPVLMRLIPNARKIFPSLFTGCPYKVCVYLCFDSITRNFASEH